MKRQLNWQRWGNESTPLTIAPCVTAQTEPEQTYIQVSKVFPNGALKSR